MFEALLSISIAVSISVFMFRVARWRYARREAVGSSNTCRKKGCEYGMKDLTKEKKKGTHS